jgi:hypothetical protein
MGGGVQGRGREAAMEEDRGGLYNRKVCGRGRGGFVEQEEVSPVEEKEGVWGGGWLRWLGREWRGWLVLKNSGH